MTIQDVIGKWDFNFWQEEGKSNILTFLPDGEATTGVTFYKYEFCGEKLHLYIEDYVDYWGTFDGEKFTGTAESYSNIWHWSAKRHVAPIIKPIPEKKLFNNKWIIKNDTDELKNNVLLFEKNGVLLSSIYGQGSWKYVDKDLVVETASGFIKYIIKEIDNQLYARAKNKVGQEWIIFPYFISIPSEPPKPSALTTTKKDSNIYLQHLRDNGIYYLYHFTDRKNIANIREAGGLYSWKFLEDHDMIVPNPGGDELSRSLDRRYGLQDYVRLSFCKNHPMSFRHRKAGADIVVLKISLEPVILKDTLFSDMNATDKLHKHGGTLDDLKRVRFECTRLDYAEGMDRKYQQAEVLVKTFLPAKYILNLDEI